MLEVALLELPHHAQATVVENDDLDRQPVALHGLQFLNVQLKPAIAGDEDNRPPWFGEGRPDGCRQPEAHCPHAAGRQEPLISTDLDGLSRPHLMLADVCHIGRGLPVVC